MDGLQADWPEGSFDLGHKKLFRRATRKRLKNIEIQGKKLDGVLNIRWPAPLAHLAGRGLPGFQITEI